MAYNNPTIQNNISAKPTSQPAYTRGPTAPPQQQGTRSDIHSAGSTYRSGQNYDHRGADEVSGLMEEERLLEAQLRKQQDIVHNKMLEVRLPLVYILLPATQCYSLFLEQRLQYIHALDRMHRIWLI